MIQMLCENSEISQFLRKFPSNQWGKVIESLTVLGIRQAKSQNSQISQETLDRLVSQSPGIKQTINYLKQEVKSLSNSIRKIERKTLSSSSLAKEHRQEPNNNLNSQNLTLKQRNSSCKSLKTHVKFDGNKAKDIQEPKTCTLKDAKLIIKYLKPPSSVNQRGFENNDSDSSIPSHSSKNSYFRNRKSMC